MAQKSTPADEAGVEQTVDERPASETSIRVDPLDRLGLADWFGRWPDRLPIQWPERFLSDVSDIRLEEFMDGDDFVVRAEIPGVDPERDVEISVDHGRLSIRAEREERSEKTDDGYHSEFRYGSFARVLTLPDGAKTGDIAASCTDGVLEIRVPIDESSGTRRAIPVTRS